MALVQISTKHTVTTQPLKTTTVIINCIYLFHFEKKDRRIRLIILFAYCPSWQQVNKILANRLNKYISTIIYPKQVGFIPRRFFYFNVHRLLNIIYNNQNISKSAVLALDAYKAFDQVEWKYMLLTIRDFGLGENFSFQVEMPYPVKPRDTIPFRRAIEQDNIDTSLPALLHAAKRSPGPFNRIGFMVEISLNVWYQIKKKKNI